MTNLRKAREQGKLAEFVAEHKQDAPGDQTAFDATLSSMAGKSKSKPGTSKPGRSGD